MPDRRQRVDKDRQVFSITHGYYRPGVVVGKVQAFTDLAAVHGQEQRAGLAADVAVATTSGAGRVRIRSDGPGHGLVVLAHQLFKLIATTRLAHHRFDAHEVAQQAGLLPPRVQLVHEHVRRHEAQHAVRHRLAHVQQHAAHFVLEPVRVGVAVLAVQIDVRRAAGHRRHPALARLDHVVGLERDRELRAQFRLE